MATVALLGTLDTKGREYAFLRERLREHGVDVLVVDAGIHEPVGLAPDIAREEVARAGGADVARARSGGRPRRRGRGDGARARRRSCASFTARAGSTASSRSAARAARRSRRRAMRALPVGVPKLLVSTVASGDTRPYVGAVDVTMMYSVVDISGVNSISARIMANAAGAIAGMVKAAVPQLETKPLVAATMFGVTTPCVTAARERLEELGYEVLVFHATGAGGQSMEALAKDGFLAGVLDATTTELADELVGGVLSAGPDRLEAAGAAGVPQVVSLGALDMVNFGPRETVPARFDDRNLYVHNPTVTLMRTTPEECARARTHDRPQALRGDGPDRALRPAAAACR